MLKFVKYLDFFIRNIKRIIFHFLINFSKNNLIK